VRGLRISVPFRGIPLLSIGVGGDSGGIHTTDEWYSSEHGALGVERAADRARGGGDLNGATASGERNASESLQKPGGAPIVT